MGPYAIIIRDNEALGNYHIYITDETFETMEEAERNFSGSSNAAIIDLRTFNIPDDDNFCDLCKRDLSIAVSRERGR